MTKSLSITVCGRVVEASTEESLLDALARLAPTRIARGDYCRTGECAHCEVWLADGEPVLACVRRVRAADDIVRVSAHLAVDLDATSK